MTDTPDPALFSVNERPRDYTAVIEIRATIRVSLQADSIEEAKALAEAEAKKMIEDPFDVTLDDIDAADVQHTSKDQPMYRVWENGHAMQVSHLRPGHTPREPDERGF
ncbi:hypothetical protein [Methylobrevis pamukkalensis]|uniref:Uncharacterized protein n=1 Tax=Methylobrevis pamukkalensis TaxID=1439726 RepID=A0A1E3H783_9HYPH|nr:hypothetical protein [Methylobrevis pamukkalensis]ODN72193.1 hypothetical protein A6302_00491 [Methylobrevis pamukkalensis]